MSLETIVNEIRQNSQERMREIENELIYKYVELIEYIAKTVQDLDDKINNLNNIQK